VREAARDIGDISGVQRELVDLFADGMAVAVELIGVKRLLHRRRVQAPDLAAGDLDDEDVVCVPVRE
jgi:hypothetical protein